MTRLRYASPLITIMAALTLAAGVWFHSGWLRRLELPIYDALLRMRQRAAPAEVILIAIDEASLDALGDWPWPRRVLADAIRRLTAAGAAVVGVDLLWPRQAWDPAREAVAGGDPTPPGSPGVEQRRDEPLESALREAGRVVLPLEMDAPGGEARPTHPFTPGLPLPRRGRDLIRHEPLMAVKLPRLPVPGWAISEAAPPPRIVTPWPPLAQAALALGHRQVLPDPDGRVRSLPLFLQAGDAWYPAQALLLAARLRGVAVEELQIVRRTPGTATLFWGRSATLLEGGLRLGLAFPPPRGLPPSVPIADLFAGRIPREVLQGRIAILGLTAASAVSRYPTPGDSPLAAAQITALAAASLLSGPPAVRPWWAPLLEIAVLAYFLLFALLALPRVPGPVAAGMLGGFTLTWGGAVALMGLVQGLWLWFWPPALLATAALLCSTLRSLRETLLRQRLELCRTQGLALQSRGLLDEALEKFLEGPRRDPALKALLCELAQEYERKRLFAQASRVYAQILEAGAHREARRRLRRLEELAQGATLPGPAASGAATVVLTGAVAPPTFGRYEILREIGRGAMGTVYLGRDPRIDRPVAVKTLSYASLPDAELEEVKARFFREAQAAGKLSHPNIVTVFDAGEERDCAWLAMEYLEGATLEGHCAKDRRLPPDRVLEVGEAVAEALAYAHGQGVVHRDIKPANIMLLEDGRVKVTDFGIARIMDVARTRTGILMGTPGYMSPEQVAGKRVDGRSDLFSLGIVLYELLAGRRPFEGESLATVMARIGRTPHTPLREIVPGLPPGLEAVVDKLLAKGLNRRYRSADQAAEELRRCRGMRKPST